ncbi:hypothetical protein, partial [Klebsiella pneumoniae]|uniref:hypothetical protein n=1 Tax=Klebsiella pneumoniae TaxID=573 RepID=UPI00117B8BE4
TFTFLTVFSSGVRELFEQEPPLPPRKTRAEMMKDIDADYYGYRDDDDGILVPLEMRAEKQCKARYEINAVVIFLELKI